MSIEANTYEEMTVHNVNNKTKELCEALSEYLIKDWGIGYICLLTDGKKNESKDPDSIPEGSELYAACRELPSSKEVSLCLRAVNDGGVSWRMESSFMKLLTDDPDITQNVVYRSTDYYDIDTSVDMYLFNEKGLQHLDYQGTADQVKDIQQWYCYTPNILISDEDNKENAKLHDQAVSVLTKLCLLLGIEEDEFDYYLEDDWEECGEIRFSSASFFANSDVPEIVDLANQLSGLFHESEGADFQFEICAVPDGENDYDFASVAIKYDREKKTVRDFYCRF